MYKDYLVDFIIHENESIYKAAWQMQRNKTNLLVVNDDDKFVGIVGEKEVKNSFFFEGKCVADIMNRNPTKIVAAPETDLYSDARNIFAEKGMQFIPVVDEENNVIDMFSQQRAFFLRYYRERRLQKMNYAESIFNAVHQAQQLGIKGFSVIEFGVAGGNGLVAAEFYAREISRLSGINIEVYGFDNATGLPKIKNLPQKEAAYMWQEGMFNVMDVELLQKRLRSAKLVLGDIEESLETFNKIYNPLPIGVIFVDVDRYESICPILRYLENNEERFFPRIEMYFDDIIDATDSIGEHLAVQEFNRRNDNIKILPEGSYVKTKVCFRYSHPLYNAPYKEAKEFTGCNYSLYTI